MLKPFEQYPDPDWAREALDGSPEQIQALERSIVEVEKAFGDEAGVALRKEMKRLMGRAMLKKVERDAPTWDGKTRIVG